MSTELAGESIRFVHHFHDSSLTYLRKINVIDDKISRISRIWTNLNSSIYKTIEGSNLIQRGSKIL